MSQRLWEESDPAENAPSSTTNIRRNWAEASCLIHCGLVRSRWAVGCRQCLPANKGESSAMPTFPTPSSLLLLTMALGLQVVKQGPQARSASFTGSTLAACSVGTPPRAGTILRVWVGGGATPTLPGSPIGLDTSSGRRAEWGQPSSPGRHFGAFNQEDYNSALLPNRKPNQRMTTDMKPKPMSDDHSCDGLRVFY